jgi:hypothetical protein
VANVFWTAVFAYTVGRSASFLSRLDLLFLISRFLNTQVSELEPILVEYLSAYPPLDQLFLPRYASSTRANVKSPPQNFATSCMHDHEQTHLFSRLSDVRKQYISLHIFTPRAEIATGCGLHDRGVGVPVGSRFLTSPYRPDRLWGPSNLLSNVHRWLFSRGVKRRGVKLNAYLESVSRSREHGSIHPLLRTCSWRSV